MNKKNDRILLTEAFQLSYTKIKNGEKFVIRLKSSGDFEKKVTVKDLDKVASEDKWKQNGALGLVLKGNGVQAIYGPKADILKSNIQDIIGV